MEKITFINHAPDDKEWTAHINILNDWTEPDRYLRQIIQVARGGRHYPADMHVDLIEQVMKARDTAKEREVLGLPEDGKWYDISLQAKAGERVLIANYQRRESDHLRHKGEADE